MLTIRQISNHLEIAFWAFIIRLLSDSKFLRRLLPVLYRLFCKETVIPIARRVWLYGFSGFCVGLIVGVIFYS